MSRDLEFNLTRLLSNLPGMVFRCSLDRRRTILYASQGSYELTGYRPAELIGNRDVAFGDLIHPGDKATALGEIHRAVAEKRPYQCTYRLTSADGQRRQLLERGKVVFTEDGSANYAEAFVTENSDQWLAPENRSRLARELHDSVTQSLYSVTLFAGAGKTLAESQEYRRACGYFDDILETGQQAMKELRLILHNLRPPVLEQEGLVRALGQRLKAVEGRAGVKYELVVDEDLELNPQVEEALYYIAMEALNNAIQHAYAGQVKVLLNQGDDGRVTLTVSDNGVGFEPDRLDQSGGLGLITMREWAESFAGQIAVNSTVGKGTTVVAKLKHDQPGNSRTDG